VRLGGFVIPPEEALVVGARELIVPHRLGDARLFEVGDRLGDRVGLSLVSSVSAGENGARPRSIARATMSRPVQPFDP
jgi:hypothetical protein